jgi:glycine cleavage system H protein
MGKFLEATYDKFIFRVQTDCLYTKNDFWVYMQGNIATVGVTDFLQKVSGDVVLLETIKPGTEVKQGQGIGTIETIKATFDMLSPVTGTVAETNPEMTDNPYLINQDPYGTGWIYRIELTDPNGDKAGLLNAEEYFRLMQDKINQEAKRLYG